jgi:NAD(P)-dependent dehydrogenase (short-subunit alcohol dehydrogenase family)
MLDNTRRGQELLARTPMARFGKTEELVGAAVYLCSDGASFITGQTPVVDGGFLASGVNPQAGKTARGLNNGSVTAEIV